MEFIPQEVLVCIFKHLNLTDRKEAALVCWKWYYASLDPMLLKDTVVTFHAPSTPSDSFLKIGHRKMPHLILDEIDGSFNAKQFLLNQCDHLTGNLQTLSLKGSNITEKFFTELLAKCQDLKALDLSCCNSLFMSGLLLSKPADRNALKRSLMHVRSLNLSSIRFLSDTTFDRLTDVCPNIEDLHLAGNEMVFHAGRSNRSSQSANVQLTFKNILTFVEKNASHIKSLDFSRTMINDDSLMKLAQVKGLELEEIHLVCCREAYSAGIAGFTKKQVHLKVVNLSKCLEISDEALNSICNNLHKIRCLQINKCQQITDASVKNINLLDTLERLEIAGGYATSDALVKGLCKGKLKHLHHLNLNCCYLVKDSFVTQMCQYLPNLTFLDIESSKITDVSLQQICQGLTSLRVLNLSWCKEITDKGLTGEPLEKDKVVDKGANANPNGNQMKTKPADKKLYAQFKNSIANGDIDTDRSCTATDRSINNLKCLQSLSLSSCGHLTDESISRLKFQDLRCLKLGMLSGLTDVSLVALSSNVCCLEEIHLAQCSRITDRGLKALVTPLQRLVSLNISNCNITDQGLDTLRAHCTRLHTLDISMCEQLTLGKVAEVEGRLRHLQVVHKRLVGGGMAASQ